MKDHLFSVRNDMNVVANQDDVSVEDVLSLARPCIREIEQKYRRENISMMFLPMPNPYGNDDLAQSIIAINCDAECGRINPPKDLPTLVSRIIEEYMSNLDHLCNNPEGQMFFKHMMHRIAAMN